MGWLLSSSSDRRALDVVDGTGLCAGHGPHYSRRTPGSKTFTGVGQEVVLVSECGRAVWACIRQKTPMARGTGRSRHRKDDTGKQTDAKARYVWRNIATSAGGRRNNSPTPSGQRARRRGIVGSSRRGRRLLRSCRPA